MYPNPPIALQITIPAVWPLSPIDRDILTLRLRYALNNPEFWSASDDGDFTTHLVRLTGNLFSLFRGTTIITDDWSGYAGLAKRNHLHTAVPERGDMQVAETFLPIIHLVFSNRKTWLRGIHHGVSPQHLQAYLNEFTFRFNRRFYPFNAFRSLLGIAGERCHRANLCRALCQKITIHYIWWLGVTTG
jgi:hypothetical protein